MSVRAILSNKDRVFFQSSRLTAVEFEREKPRKKTEVNEEEDGNDKHSDGVL